MLKKCRNSKLSCRKSHAENKRKSESFSNSRNDKEETEVTPITLLVF